MDKLSSILPASPRVTSVDTSDSPPARPGAPTLGKRAGITTIGDRFTLSQNAKELVAKDTMMGRNPKDAAQAKMVEKINRDFFNTRVKPVEKEIPVSEEVSAREMDIADRVPPMEQAIEQYEDQAPEPTGRLSIEA